jgi:mono/diheme cytochrome c family protein
MKASPPLVRLIMTLIAWAALSAGIARAGDPPAGGTLPPAAERAAAAPSVAPSAPTVPVDTAALYAGKCAECHGIDRLGLMGPALLPANLGRLKPADAAAVIRDGRPATKMEGFRGKLSDAEVDALVKLIFTPPAAEPVWGAAEIVRSRVVHADPVKRPEKPVFSADPLNLFVVVEAGDQHATILDGDTFAPLTRFETRFALHGGPKFTSDGRYVFFASRDGWISKYDLWALEVIAEVRAGIHTRNLALSPDGRTVLVGNDFPHTLVVLDAKDLSLVQIVPVQGTSGATSRVSAVYQAEPRGSFIVALKDVPELLELPIASLAGTEQARRMYGYGPFTEEMLRAAAPLAIRRVPLPGILDAFFFGPTYRFVVGAEQGTGHVDVLDLDSGTVAARLDLPGLPHLGSGISWHRDGRLLMATPNLQRGIVSIIDATDWRVVTEIETPGPGFFMRSHENAPDAWVDASMGPARDTLILIDKQKLAVRTTLTPAPGKTANHVEFDRSGRHALVSVYEYDGELVVYDARTLAVVKRLPMSKPSGKYNVFNKISRSEGTSH